MELENLNTKSKICIEKRSNNKIFVDTMQQVKRTHLFELLERDLIKSQDVKVDHNIITDYVKNNIIHSLCDDDANTNNKTNNHCLQVTHTNNPCLQVTHTNNHCLQVTHANNPCLQVSALVQDCYNNSKLLMNTNIMCNRLKEIMLSGEYNNPMSLLHRLNFHHDNDFIVISTNDINEKLQHIDSQFNRVLHQTKIAVFEKSSFLPICYLEKSLKDPEPFYIQNENSYLKNHVYDLIDGFHEREFDKAIISIHKNHIGSYIVLFYYKNKWYFLFSGIVHEFNTETHPVLYEHIGHHLLKFDKMLCYHMILVDIRLQKLIAPICDVNHVVLIKTTEKYTLNEQDCTHICDKTEQLHGVFVLDSRIYISCMDELNVILEELDVKNSRAGKLLNRGLIMKIKIDNLDVFHITYDTYIYKKLIELIPAHIGLNGVYLKLYQTDKLNYFLQYISDSYTDIVKRINSSLSTMSREILDIYHMTREKKNYDFYILLPQSYKYIIYQLHSDYIGYKNKTLSANTTNANTTNANTTNANTNNANIIDSIDLLNQSSKYKYIKKQNSKEFDVEEFDDSTIKVSITVDNVYKKLKDLDTHLLIELYKDREVLLNSIESSVVKIINNPIKYCINTCLQTTLLKSNRPI